MMKLLVILAATALLATGVIACKGASAVPGGDKAGATASTLSKVLLEIPTLT